MASFSIQHCDENEDGWGPVSVPEKFKEIPYYAPFSKGDKLGKASDWQQPGFSGKQRYQRDQKGQSDSVNTIFNWYYQDDDASFQLVDNTKAQPSRRAFGKRFQQRGYQQMKTQHQRGQQQQQQQQQQQSSQQKGKRNQRQNLNKQWGKFQGPQQQSRKREPSIHIKPDWTHILNVDFNVLAKCYLGFEPEPEDIKSCGFLEYYIPDYDRISPRTEKLLERSDRTFFNVSTSDDPVLCDLASRVPSSSEDIHVFATDSIISHLMAATRSVHPWDIIVKREGNKVFFNKRDGSWFDFLTVNETATEPPVEDNRDIVNSPSSLGKEATLINQNFSQQILNKGERYTGFTDPNPFETEGVKVAAVAYRYRRWTLGGGVVLTARTEIDGVSKSKGKDVFLTIKAVNEIDPRGDWCKVIDSQRGAVLATELKNNSCKLAKWTAQALLAGTDDIKLGYVARLSPRDNSSHVILATQDYKPKEFATQINLNTRNIWGVFKYFVDLIVKQGKDGTFVLLKDPERTSVMVYSVPDGTLSKEVAQEEEPDINA